MEGKINYPNYVALNMKIFQNKKKLVIELPFLKLI